MKSTTGGRVGRAEVQPDMPACEVQRKVDGKVNGGGGGTYLHESSQTG